MLTIVSDIIPLCNYEPIRILRTCHNQILLILPCVKSEQQTLWRPNLQADYAAYLYKKQRRFGYISERQHLRTQFWDFELQLQSKFTLMIQCNFVECSSRRSSTLKFVYKIFSEFFQTYSVSQRVAYHRNWNQVCEMKTFMMNIRY